MRQEVNASFVDQKKLSDEKILRRATYASVLVASILIVIKALAWFLTDSVSILASLVDSSMDAVASLINLFAVAHSLVPADKEHRFGHGKVESLAGLGQSVFILVSAVFLLLSAANRLQNPQELGEVWLGTGVMLTSLLLTSALLLFQRYVVRRTGSLAVKADALHYRADLFTNAAILLALFLSVYGYAFFDSVFAIIIAVYIVYSAWGIAREAVQILLDRELPDKVREQIITVAKSVLGVRGIHDLRTRRSGVTCFVQLHIDLDENLSLKDAHQIADAVEDAICAEIPEADVIIHEDPVATYS
ncbi:MAG: cation diffusion facilitator family transporter [Gammaproteobacteria bacterium]|nr:cation diffusion facilitator family transporter [Gammaproteobacteria bacterium]